MQLFYNLLNSSKSFKDGLHAKSADASSSMLDTILSEIDSNVDNKESRERIRQMLIQMHNHLNEKINELQNGKNKIFAEYDDFKASLHAENEQLRSQLKMLHLQNEHYIKSTSTNGHNLGNQMLPPSQSPSLSNMPPQSPKSNSHKSSNVNNNALNTSPTNLLIPHPLHLQNFFQSPKSQDLHAALSQSFPFFMNHYASNLGARTHQPNITLGAEPVTSTPKKSFMSSFASSNSSSNSSTSFNNSKHNSNTMSASNAGNLVFHLANKCEPPAPTA